MSAQLSGNTILTSNPALAYELYSPSITFAGKNVNGLQTGVSDVVASASTMLIPDDPVALFVSGTTTVNNIRTYSQNTAGFGVVGFNMGSNGSGYTSQATATFTGGACSIQPTAVMYINATGVVTG